MLKETFNDQTPYLVIVAVVAVTAVITLVMNGSNGNAVQGAAIEGCVEGPTIGDVYTREYVTVNGKQKWDYCVGDNLHQFACGTPRIAEETGWFQCEFGCENGACLRQSTYG